MDGCLLVVWMRLSGTSCRLSISSECVLGRIADTRDRCGVLCPGERGLSVSCSAPRHISSLPACPFGPHRDPVVTLRRPVGPASRPSLQRFAASAGSTTGVMIEGCGLAGIRELVLSQLHPTSLMLGMLLPFSAPQFVHVSLVDFNITYIMGCVN